MEEVAESREGVETVIDWPVAVAVDIAPCTLVEGLADGDAKAVKLAVEVALELTLTDSDELTLAGLDDDKWVLMAANIRLEVTLTASDELALAGLDEA